MVWFHAAALTPVASDRGKHLEALSCNAAASV
eukprot:COSAG06_NODE_67642_length_251_cov_0.802632_1_plen_32_part_01